MAIRPVYVASKTELNVDVVDVEFEWFPGFSKIQKQKSYQSLHQEFQKKYNIKNILEISSSSENDLGKKLSAFNLILKTQKNKLITVEAAFQGSKVFDNGGPYTDLYGTDSLKAKKDERLKTSGNLVSFSFFGDTFPINPQTFFYDWIYINTLHKNKELSNEVMEYEAFTDIEFNPNKSINNQAQSAALYVSLIHSGLLEKAICSKEDFLSVLKDFYLLKGNATFQLKIQI